MIRSELNSVSRREGRESCDRVGSGCTVLYRIIPVKRTVLCVCLLCTKEQFWLYPKGQIDYCCSIVKGVCGVCVWGVCGVCVCAGWRVSECVRCVLGWDYNVR